MTTGTELDGPRIRSDQQVKIVRTIGHFADTVHPGKRHEWYEMLHFGQRGTGYAQCRCGAVGDLYPRKYIRNRRAPT